MKKKKEKPILAKNIISRRKALGFKSAEKFAEFIKMPYPTLRDIEGGVNSGLDETKLIIANGLGCTLSDLYKEPNTVDDLKDILVDVLTGAKIKNLDVSYLDVLRMLRNESPKIVAVALGILFDREDIIEPHLSDKVLKLLIESL